MSIETLRASLADRYRIERELGAGGMATVYLAQDLKHDRRVAVKVLHPDLAATIGVERFLSEIKVTANLQHPNILGLFDSGVADGQAYYVMPYVDGESLRDRLDREKQLPVADALRIATGVAAALDYAHAHGVIHRDIKPENILLQSGQPVVADFGIALAVQQAGGQRLTQTGMSLGTPQYMSPEQAMGERAIDGRTDIYALGVITYEMLAGEPPFSGPNTQAIVARVLTEKARPLAQLREMVSPPVEAAVHRALQKLPADRFTSAAAFAQALADDHGRDERRKTSEVPSLSASPLAFLRWALPCLVITTLAFIFGKSRGPAPLQGSLGYLGTLLSSPQVAMYPKVSPDGKTVAFAAMVDRQTQVAVLNPVSGDWKILTHDTARGFVEAITWSADGALIYYDRLFDIPRGIYSISPLGDNDRLILPNAASPSLLPDGSIVAWRPIGGGHDRMIRFWPQNGREDTLPAYTTSYPGGRYGATLPGGREVVFIGGTERHWAIDTIYALNVETKKTRRLGIRGQPSGQIFTISPDGRQLFMVTHVADDARVIAMRTDGSGDETTLFSTTPDIAAIDAGPDGSVYVDQQSRPVELVRFAPGSAQPERTPAPARWAFGVLPLPDGRVLAEQSAGRTWRFVASEPGKDPVAFLASGESGRLPIALLGADRVMMRTNPQGVPGLTIAYAASGQVAGRIAGFDHDAFAGSPDGKTIYYADSGAIWSMPSIGGTRRRIHDGDAVATDPHGQYLVIQWIRDDGARLFHVPLDGSASQEIAIRGDMVLATARIAPNAVAADGRILVAVVSSSSWFWPGAILDPKTGVLTVVPPGLGFDMFSPGWDNQGRVVTPSQGLESTLWRFSPLGSSQP